MKRMNTEKFSKIVVEDSSDTEDEFEENQSSEDDEDVEQHQEEEASEEVSDEESGLDLAASATDSDENDVDDDEEDLEELQEDIKPKPSKAERIRNELVQKYQERQGKQLYIRFPHKVAETEEALEKEVKELTPLVVKVHKPRQKHARFCLADFATNEDRDTAFKQLKKAFSKGDLAKYVVSIPKTESQELVSELAERKIKSIENKKAKNRLKKASKKALTENHFTSTVIVLNLPKTVTAVEIRELFPNAVDIQIKSGKGKMNKEKSIAAINLPTTMDARNAIKKQLSLGGNQLTIKFDNQKMGRNKKRKIEDVKTADTTTEGSEPAAKRAKLEPNPEILKNESQPQTEKLKTRKPFKKGEKPFKKEGIQPFKGNKPFDRHNKPFNRGNKPFDKGNKHFNKGNKPFNKPFNKGNQNFNNKPFNRGNKPFNKSNKPFNKDSKPFHKCGNPFNKGQNNFGNKKPEVTT